MGLSGSKKTKSTTTTTPWAPGQPYIMGALSGLQTANNTAQGNVSRWTPSIDAAIDRINTNIATPPQFLTDARDQLDRTIRGDYVNSNPYTGAIADQIAQKTGAQYNQTFGGGRATGGLAALLSSQGVGDALQQFYMNQYNTDRGMQQQAIMAAPGFHQDMYTDQDRLMPLISGGTMLPMQVANAYGAGVGNLTAPYNTSKTVQKESGGGLGQILGLGLSLASMFMPGGGLGGVLGGGGAGTVGAGGGAFNLGGGTSSFFGANPIGGFIG